MKFLTAAGASIPSSSPAVTSEAPAMPVFSSESQEAAQEPKASSSLWSWFGGGEDKKAPPVGFMHRTNTSDQCIIQGRSTWPACCNLTQDCVRASKLIRNVAQQKNWTLCLPPLELSNVCPPPPPFFTHTHKGMWGVAFNALC